MARRYTRKQLKQPDEFITWSNRIWQWVRDHAARAIVMLSVAVVIVAAVWTWSYYAEKQARKATVALSRALEIYNRGVIDEQGAEKQEAEGPPHFKTRQAKLEAAEKEFDQVATKQASSDIGDIAILMRASVRYQLGKLPAAVKDYERFLSRARRDSRFRHAAIEGLIYALEAQKKWDAALKAVARLPRQGDKRFAALYHEARILLAKGDKKGALKRYREIVDQANTRPLVKSAERWLVELEGA